MNHDYYVSSNFVKINSSISEQIQTIENNVGGKWISENYEIKSKGNLFQKIKDFFLIIITFGKYSLIKFNATHVLQNFKRDISASLKNHVLRAAEMRYLDLQAKVNHEKHVSSLKTECTETQARIGDLKNAINLLNREDVKEGQDFSLGNEFLLRERVPACVWINGHCVQVLPNHYNKEFYQRELVMKEVEHLKNSEGNNLNKVVLNNLDENAILKNFEIDQVDKKLKVNIQTNGQEVKIEFKPTEGFFEKLEESKGVFANKEQMKASMQMRLESSENTFKKIKEELKQASRQQAKQELEIEQDNLRSIRESYEKLRSELRRKTEGAITTLASRIQKRHKLQPIFINTIQQINELYEQSMEATIAQIERERPSKDLHLNYLKHESYQS